MVRLHQTGLFLICFIFSGCVPSDLRGTATQTQTPSGKLSPKAQDIVIALSEDNGGCELPCFWGITSGQTAWKDANAFISQINRVDHLDDYPDGLKDGLETYHVGLDMYDGTHTMISDLWFFIEDDVVQRLEVEIYARTHEDYAKFIAYLQTVSNYF